MLTNALMFMYGNPIGGIYLVLDYLLCIYGDVFQMQHRTML
jgi:hypothetical protein